MTTPPAGTEHDRPANIPATAKRLLFAIRPPDNWDDLTQDEKLAWSEAIVQETVKPS